MLSRRNLLTKSIAAVMVSVPYLQGCLAKKPSEEFNGDASVEPINWAQFIQMLDDIAQTQFSSEWNQEAYVQDVVALMTLLQLEEDEFNEFYDGYVDSLGKFPEMDTVHDGDGVFEVVTLEFKEGSEIGLHNHPDMTGVILCLSGQISVQSYNLLEETSSSGNLLIEQIEDITLGPGEFTTLTAARGNIHALQATQYAALLDVFTPPYDEERLQRYRSYERSVDAVEDNIYEAWEV